MANFAYDISDPSSAASDALSLQKDSATISDYCSSLIYVCDQIAENWDGEDGTYFIERLRNRAEAIRGFATEGIYPMAQGIEQYSEAMQEITARSAK